MELDPNGDELDALYPEGGSRILSNANEDDENDNADEDSDPREPALGGLDREIDQARWAAGGRRDLEVDGANPA